MDINEAIGKMPLKEDCKFIREQLSRFPSNKHNEIFRGYLKNWKLGKDLESVSHKKQNAGRYLANCKIRERL